MNISWVPSEFICLITATSESVATQGAVGAGGVGLKLILSKAWAAVGKAASARRGPNERVFCGSSCSIEMQCRMLRDNLILESQLTGRLGARELTDGWQLTISMLSDPSIC